MWRTLIVLAALAVAPLTVNAQAVTYDFTGAVTNAIGAYSALAVGATVTGSYTFEFANANVGQSSGLAGSTSVFWDLQRDTGLQVGIAPSSAAVFSDSVRIGTFTYSTAAPGTYSSESLVLGNPGPASAPYFDASETQQPSAANTYTQSTLYLGAGSTPEWGNNGLPLDLTTPIFNNFGEVVSVTNGSISAVFFEISTLTPVPLPGAAGLMLFGLGALSALRRQRRAAC
jgi:hypothetical protein